MQYIAKNNYITFNKKQYKQTKGIPQGLCISYILSSFYYANLEDSQLEFLRKERLPSTLAGQPAATGEDATMVENPEEGAADTMVVDSGAEKQQNAPSDAKNVELNCLMRLTDDYLLMTTSKNNAMLFIEKMYKLSQVSNFKFNMRKLRTNFPLNLQKIGCQDEGHFNNVDVDRFNWIGISIDMASLQLYPNMNTSKDGVLCTLNINIQTQQSVVWLKKKLKS